MSLLSRLHWPWDHYEAAHHAESVEERDLVVDQIVEEAKRQLEEDGFGLAVQRALQKGEQKE